MTQTQIFFYMAGLLCGAVDQTVGSPHQKSVYMSVNIGDNMTLECPHNSQVFKYYWFKQSLGEIPRLVSVIYRGAYDRVLEDELKNDTRFKLIIDENKNNLDISNVQLSDSATYFCTMSYSMIFKFVQSITVFVKGTQFNVNAIQQLPHEEIESGRSVILNCSIQTERCAGRHKVHWFKQSEKSIAGVLYSHGGSSSDQCESKTDSPTNSCVYNLPIHNVSSEQTGTYYCAVAACGQVLFGNGTKLSTEAAPVSVFILSGALIFTSSLLIGTTFCFCIKNSSGPHTQTSVSSKKTKGFPKVFKYMAAKQVAEEGRRQINGTWSECVYFNVEMDF